MTPASFPEVLESAASAWPGGLAVEEGDVRLTFSALLDLARRCATGLHDLGVRPGHRVAIQAPNQWEWIVAALGAHLAGTTLVPINTRYKGAETRDILTRSRAACLFTSTGLLPVDLRGQLGPIGLPVITFRDDFAAWLPTLARPLPDVDPSTPSDLLFTSGTTGHPKGVLTAHAQNVRAYADWASITGLSPADRYLVVAPFFHAFGYKAGWLSALLSGATVLPQATLDVPRVLARLIRDRVTVLPGPPTLYHSLLQHPGAAAPRHLRLAVTGASVVPVPLVHAMREVLGFETVLTGYGLTESCGLVSLCHPGEPPETIATTSGRPVPEVQVRLASDGELLVSGYNLMLGYDGDPAATADALRDGWLHTGDIARLSEDDHITIIDRKKDMLIVGGFNVYPAEIERLLAGHPAISQAAVRGLPDERLGEVAAAWIVVREPITEGELLSWVRHQMANYKVPRRICFVDSLPVNAAGKVDKGALRF